MPSSFSPNLRIELIANGSQAGNWGNTTNTNLGTLVEQAISGYAQVQTTAASQAFTFANGASDQARNAMIELSTTTGAAFSVFAPPSPKLYVIFNDSAFAATIFNSTVVGNTTPAGAGVTVPAGRRIFVMSDGADFSLVTPPAASANVANTLVERDGSGNFAAGTITASLTGNVTGNVTGNLTGNVTGNITGNLTGNVAGNAGTATALQTARTIGGVSFNGTANINLPGVNTAGNQNTSGNAATATVLQNARTINGVSFNGSANITITAAATNVNTRLASLGVGTNASGVAGEIRATGNVTAFFSDDRLKTKLGRIDDALDKVNTLSGFYYVPNETAQDLGYEAIRDVGVSAQQVQAVQPEAVAPAPIDEKYLTVRYERLVPLLIEAIKELDAKVKALEAK